MKLDVKEWDRRDSDVIRLLRFPLAMMVVFLHAEPCIEGWDITRMSCEHMPSNIAGTIMMAISHIITQVAVPAFFLISGFLFFKRLERWNASEWKRKIASRAGSIMLPYVIWVTIFAAVHIMRHLGSIVQPDGLSAGITAWLREQGGLPSLYWNSSHWIAGARNCFGQQLLMSGPFPFHLWFLRDLMVAILLSPLLYILLRQRKGGGISTLSVVSILSLSVLYFTQLRTTIPGLSFSTLFYFGLGAFMSLNGLRLSRAFYRYRRIAGIFALVMLAVLIPMDGGRTQAGTYIMPFWIFSGVLTAVNIASAYEGDGYARRLSLKYEDSSFFLFIIHPFFLGLVWAVMGDVASRLFGAEDIVSVRFVDAHPVVTLLLFMTKVFLAATLSILTYRLAVRILPKTTRIICGR